MRWNEAAPWNKIYVRVRDKSEQNQLRYSSGDLHSLMEDAHTDKILAALMWLPTDLRDPRYDDEE